MMLCSGLSSTLLLAATCSLITSGFIRAQVSVPPPVTPISTGRVVTSNGLSVPRLSCVGGMIIVRSAEYRCGGEVTWSHGDAVNNVRNSCDGKTECDIQSNITYDPGVCKYLETTYDCFPRHSVICEGSQANLQCDEGQVIVVSWANYGRRDTTTCLDGNPNHVKNVKCAWSESMTYVTNSCNGTNNCTVEAKNLPDPCGGTYKYLEVFYTCQNDSCPAGWTWFGSRCFIVNSSMKTWTDAESSCKTLSGNLASYHSTAEYTFIRELTRTAAGSYTPAWVGGNDRENETVWKWSDGSQFDFTNWGSGQPDNHGGGEDCMEINPNGRDYVNDSECHSQRGFVCVRGP